MAAAAVAAAAVEAATALEAAGFMRHSASMDAATQAGMPAPRVSVRDAAVVEAAECARTAGLEVAGLVVQSESRVCEGGVVRVSGGVGVHYLVAGPVVGPAGACPGTNPPERR